MTQSLLTYIILLTHMHTYLLACKISKITRAMCNSNHLRVLHNAPLQPGRQTHLKLVETRLPMHSPLKPQWPPLRWYVPLRPHTTSSV